MQQLDDQRPYLLRLGLVDFGRPADRVDLVAIEVGALSRLHCADELPFEAEEEAGRETSAQRRGRNPRHATTPVLPWVVCWG